MKAAGKQSLSIERTGQGGWDFVKQFPELPVDEGKLRFSMRYRVEKGARIEVVFYFLDAAGKEVGKGPIAILNEGSTRAFESVERELELPEGARTCGLDVILKQPGKVWIDEVSAVLLGYAPAKLGPLELENPGFDESTQGWRAHDAGSGTLAVSIDTRTKHGGKGALRLERKSPRLFPEDGLWASAPELGKARAARLGCALRVEEGTRAAVVLQVLDARGVALATKRLEVASTGGRFEARELEVELPAGSARLDVHLFISGSGKAWFDELALGKR